MMANPIEGSARMGAKPKDWLIGGGEMGKLIRSMDWSKTLLGPIESWPQSLRTTVSLCLASNFPISLAWGPKHIQIYNDGYWPICGAKHPQSMGQDFSECWASPWPVIGDAFERALAGETSYLENQRMFLDRNGYAEETFFTFSFSPICDETGGVGGLFHPVTETTSRMLSERRTRALRDLAARTGKAQTIQQVFMLAAQTLVESNLDLPFTLFYLLDGDSDTAQLIAHAGLELGTTATPAVIHWNVPQPQAWPLAEIVRSGQAQQVDNLEARFGPLACDPYPESPQIALALPITLPGYKRPAGVVFAGVSPRLPLNDAYRAFYDSLAAGVTTAAANAQAYEEERKRAEALAEIDRAKTAFFSDVSHEFRTPLTLMLGPLEDELAERIEPLPPARRERLELVLRNSMRLLKLVNTLLDFSRIEAGRIQASYEPTDLSTQTADLASVFRSAIEKAGLTLTVDCAPLPEPIYVDRDMWEKIVLNLVSNAFKHTFEGGIHVSLRWLEDHAELVVADSGVGISDAELPRLFERFYRIKGAKSRTHEGTGIGLALVQELVRLHDGTVRVETQEGKGSTFTVTVKPGHTHLPRERLSAARTPALTTTRAAAYLDEALHWLPEAPGLHDASLHSVQTDLSLAPREPATVSDAGRRRILWADDNADMRDYVRRLLGGQYDVQAVPDGLAALAAARHEPPDLVLTDVMMPGLDGFSLLRELRTDARTQTIPVILLSARAGEESAVEGLDAGADDYLAKPFSARELLARVRTHLELACLRRQWTSDLERANKELESFTYSVSHDLRAPLRTIDAFSRVTLDEYATQLPAEAQHYLTRIRHGTERMSALIDGLLNFSRLGRQSLTKRTVDTAEVLRESLAELQHEQDDRDVNLKIGALPACEADHTLLKQVFINLLSNAFKYTRTRERACIEVDCHVRGSEQVFCVRDNGVGFDMRYADKLFGVFQRLHSEKEFEGTGVGLAIVDRVVQRHGGRVWADAETDQGAAFYFTVPVDGQSKASMPK